MYASEPDVDELASFGLMPTDFEAHTIELWPENDVALTLFASISTQWRTGSAGPIGLDYNVLFHRLDRLHLAPLAYEHLFDDIRTIEQETLAILHKK